MSTCIRLTTSCPWKNEKKIESSSSSLFLRMWVYNRFLIRSSNSNRFEATPPLSLWFKIVDLIARVQHSVHPHVFVFLCGKRKKEFEFELVSITWILRNWWKFQLTWTDKEYLFLEFFIELFLWYIHLSRLILSAMTGF